MKLITKIGITGNIGSGKSTVAKMFADYGLNYLDADKAVHDYYNKGHKVYEQVISEFGNEILDSDKNIDRKKLGNIVFSDKTRLEKLEAIAYAELRKQLEELPNNPVNIVEGALLFEKGFTSYFDKNILVYVPKSIARERAIKRGMTGNEFEKRWKFQMSPQEKRKYTDFIIDNDGNLNYTKQQVKRFIKKNVPEYFNAKKFYDKNNMAYHNWNHVLDCLNEFKGVRNLIVNPKQFEIAILYHDAIYDTHAEDNEEKSAKLAYRDSIRLGFPRGFANNVSDLILFTKHDKIPENMDGKIIVDVDLAILGADKEKFDEYEKNIREEYSWVLPREYYNKERSEILQSFLDRGHIYATDFFREKYEIQAIDNLKRSLNNLK